VRSRAGHSHSRQHDRPGAEGTTSAPGPIRAHLGNAAIQRLVHGATHQGAELEAARVADGLGRSEVAPGGPLGGTAAPAPPPALPGLGAGRGLDAPARAALDPYFGRDLGFVRVHTDGGASTAARRASARAFTVGRDVVFGAGQYRPGSADGLRLIAHELTHVFQQAEAGRPALQRQPVAEVAAPMTEYEDPLTGMVYHLGDTAGSRVLTGLEPQPGAEPEFRWLDLATGRVVSGTSWDWESPELFRGAFGSRRTAEDMGLSLSPDEWLALGDDPLAGLLQLHEEHRIELPDEVVLDAYKGMIYSEATAILDRNEAALDDVLQTQGVDHFVEYAQTLKDASRVRDALDARAGDIKKSFVQAQGFTFGYAGTLLQTDAYQRMQAFGELASVNDARSFWNASFPLLSRFPTDAITPERVETKLREVKDNIGQAREYLDDALHGDGPLDLMDLDAVRARLQGRLGWRVATTVEAEDTSRSWWGILSGVGLLAAGIALAFLPAGIFIDAAIGVALCAKGWREATEAGHLANTGMGADDGLVTQAMAHSLQLAAIVGTLGAVLGAGGAAFRPVRLLRALVGVRRAAPALRFGEQTGLARILAAAPRTTSEVEAALTALGMRPSFEEMQVLRTLSYRVAGKQVPSLSRESLDDLLRRVWENRSSIAAGQPEDAVYQMYLATTEEKALQSLSEEEYAKQIVALGGGRPAGSAAAVQRSGGYEALATYASEAGYVSDPMQHGFIHFFRAEETGAEEAAKITQRVYINVTADQAPTVMTAVVREVVDKPTQFPGISSAKIIGASAAGGRVDTIVIAAADEAAAWNVVDWLATYRAANPQALTLRQTPPMTQQVAEGVSVGMEPIKPIVGGEEVLVSFGQLRAAMIGVALRRTVQTGDESAFIQAVLAAFKGKKIDPATPHLNLK
jgi:hypothetical protein